MQNDNKKPNTKLIKEVRLAADAVDISQKTESDGVDRRGFLSCMAWAGTGMLWTVAGGVLGSTLLPRRAGAAEADSMMSKGSFSFVQISDSHIGFNKEVINKDVVGTLKQAIARINAMPVAPDFVLHTGDLTHLASADACLLQPGGTVPRLEEVGQERETLGNFLRSLERNFFSTPFIQRDLRNRVERAIDMLRRMESEWKGPNAPEAVSSVLSEVRKFFSDRPWTSLIVPSGRNAELDSFMCSEQFLQKLVRIRPEDPGLILQVEDAPGNQFALPDVFPAFRTALANSNRWPGFLVWTNSGDSEFFAVPSGRPCVEDRASWLFSHLATVHGVDLELLKTQYLREFPEAAEPSREITIIQLSDLHIGSSAASLRMPRVQQLIRNLLIELGDRKRIVFVVSGDLMDDPKDEYLDGVRGFLDFLANLGGEALLTCLGNHDVRRAGYGNENLRMAMRIPNTNGAVTWFEGCNLGIVTFNSVVGGDLARGFVGEQQLLDVGSQLDRRRASEHPRLVGIIHHHPVPVERPDWYAEPFYKRILGKQFEKTVELGDAERFLAFIGQRPFKCVLHGHKHIPHVSVVEGRVPIFGCGSSVGKIETTDGGIAESVGLPQLLKYGR
jgi:3',5'-cyclic AMP phosphodiesterase CpdA